jgi:RNA polymerase sigma-70 factor, ECF subfamily
MGTNWAKGTLSLIEMALANSDDQLIQAMARGDAGALNELYARHGAHLLNYLSAELNDDSLAQEVLQDVMFAAWKQSSRFRGESQVRTWLFAIARRQMLKARQKHAPDSIPLDDTLSDRIDPMTRQDEHEALMQAIDQLSADQQEALELIFYHGLSGPEAAGKLNISINTLKSRLFRARNALRDLLRKDDEA